MPWTGNLCGLAGFLHMTLQMIPVFPAEVVVNISEREAREAPLANKGR